jgi:hypothetical protein
VKCTLLALYNGDERLAARDGEAVTTGVFVGHTKPAASTEICGVVVVVDLEAQPARRPITP